MKAIIDKRVLNAILRKICKENDIDINNVYISKFGYVQTIDFNKKVKFTSKKLKIKNY